MITIQLSDYNTRVNVIDGARALGFDVPPDLLADGPVGADGVDDLVYRINMALQVLQAQP